MFIARKYHNRLSPASVTFKIPTPNNTHPYDYAMLGSLLDYRYILICHACPIFVSTCGVNLDILLAAFEMKSSWLCDRCTLEFGL